MNGALETALKFHRFWRDIGNDILLFGVMAEFLIDLFWPERPDLFPLLRSRKATTPFLKWYRHLLTTRGVVVVMMGLMVFAGVAVERYQGGLADDAADNIRALLEREILSASQCTVTDKFVKLLKDKPKGEVRILYKHEDTEAYFFALQISGSLRTAGWAVDGEPQSIPLNGGATPLANKDAPADVRYGGGSLTIWSNDDPVAYADNSAGSALREALGFGVDRSGVMMLLFDPTLAKNHFLAVVGQNSPIAERSSP